MAKYNIIIVLSFPFPFSINCFLYIVNEGEFGAEILRACFSKCHLHICQVLEFSKLLSRVLEGFYDSTE
jgi:hypothetical protein